MDYDIKQTLDGDVLIITFSGRVNQRNAREMTERFFEILSKAAVTRVLVDDRQLHERLPLGALYFHMRELPLDVLPKMPTVAMVECEENREFAEFSQSTAQNAGVTYRCFFDYTEALEWLRGQPSD